MFAKKGGLTIILMTFTLLCGSSLGGQRDRWDTLFATATASGFQIERGHAELKLEGENFIFTVRDDQGQIARIVQGTVSGSSVIATMIAMRSDVEDESLTGRWTLERYDGYETVSVTLSNQFTLVGFTRTLKPGRTSPLR